MKWCGLEQPLQVGDFLIQRPLTYLAESKVDFNEPSALGPLSISEKTSDWPLGYWPSFSHMGSGQRRTYLEWMVGGRSQMPPEIGYAFVFFYGLERRALVDMKDHDAIFLEVLRLRQLHLKEELKPSGSFMGYTSSLLWYLLANGHLNCGKEQVRAFFEQHRWNSERNSLALMWCHANFSHMPVWLAVRLASGGLNGQDIVSRFAHDEMRQLFTLRYLETWPDGIPMPKTTAKNLRKVAISHYSASAVLRGFTCHMEGVPSSNKIISKLTELWLKCMEEMRTLASLRSRWSRTEQNEVPTAAWAATPAALRQGHHPAKSQLAELVDGPIGKQSYAPIRISQIAALLSLPQREKLTTDHSTRLSEAIDLCGYSIEPDVRIANKNYRWDDWVVVFGAEQEPLNAPRYLASTLALRLALMVARADGQPQKAQLDIIAKHIFEVFQLSPVEWRRLRGLAGLLNGIGVDAVTTKTIIASLSETQREAMGRLMIAVVAHNGVITAQGKKSLKTTFERLDLGIERLNELLDQLHADQGVTVVRRGHMAKPGEAIPAPPQETEVRLDRDAISRLMKDTREVQQALAEAMETGEDEQDTSPQVIEQPAEVLQEETEVSSSGLSLDSRFQLLYKRLIEREMWPIAEATILARQEGHMLAGAVESINDWATETWGSPLIYEEGDAIVIELEILN